MMHHITHDVPYPYHPADFADLIDEIAKNTAPEFDHKSLTLKSKIVAGGMEIERFGKRFSVVVTGAYGVTHIRIEEVSKKAASS